MTESTAREAKVSSEYKERPLKEALAKPKDIEKAEDRGPDQIEDYHKKHPTLKPSKAVETAQKEQQQS